MLPAAGNETYGVNSDPQPRHISPEKSTYLDNQYNLKMLSTEDNETYGVNYDPRPTRIQKHKETVKA